MWSAISIRRPGPRSARSEPAALVSTRISAPAARSARTGVRNEVVVDALVEVGAALEDDDRHVARCGPTTTRPPWPSTLGRGKPGSSS